MVQTNISLKEIIDNPSKNKLVYSKMDCGGKVEIGSEFDNIAHITMRIDGVVKYISVKIDLEETGVVTTVQFKHIFDIFTWTHSEKNPGIVDIEWGSLTPEKPPYNYIEGPIFESTRVVGRVKNFTELAFDLIEKILNGTDTDKLIFWWYHTMNLMEIEHTPLVTELPVLDVFLNHEASNKYIMVRENQQNKSIVTLAYDSDKIPVDESYNSIMFKINHVDNANKFYSVRTVVDGDVNTWSFNDRAPNAAVHIIRSGDDPNPIQRYYVSNFLISNFNRAVKMCLERNDLKEIQLFWTTQFLKNSELA